MNKLMTMILRSDSYKASHWKQYPPGTEFITSYIESRGGAKESVFFGLQAFIKEYLLDPITKNDVDKAKIIIEAHGLPFNYDGWMGIVNYHDGFLPILIDAVPEGTVMETGNVQLQVSNTDSDYPWLVSHIETALLRAIWYPSTVATNSRKMKKIIYDGLVKSSDHPDDQIDFKLHDFGARGASSSETAMLGGMAHLINFKGTDTLEALVGASEYYGESMAGFSIPASEHSTITAWEKQFELHAYENMIKQFSGPGKIYACVSDSYNIYNAVNNLWGKELKEKIINSGGTLVVRPDSGDPLSVPIIVIQDLMTNFGYTVNSKGYKVLPDYIRVIQGDGITINSLPKLIENLIDSNLSLDNIAFGMGGGLLQQVNRDNLKYAMKASAISFDGRWIPIFKDPIHGGKKSKAGKLALIYENGSYQTVQENDRNGRKDWLKTVYYNGNLTRTTSFSNIRERAKI